MRSYDSWAIALAVLAFAAVPASLVLPLIGVFAKRWKLSVIFAAILGGLGLLALGIAALARAVVGPAIVSDYHGVMAFGLAVSIPPFGAACLLLGRACTTERVWKVIGSGFLVGLGTTVALGCLLVHQFVLAQRGGLVASSELIFGGLFGGIPLAVLGLVLLARAAAKAEPAT